MHAIVGSDDSCNMGTVKSSRCVVIGAGVILCKVPASDHLVARTVSFTQRHVIKGNAAIDDGNGLSFTGQTELRVNLIPTGLRVRFAQVLFDRRCDMRIHGLC